MFFLIISVMDILAMVIGAFVLALLGNDPIGWILSGSIHTMIFIVLGVYFDESRLIRIAKHILGFKEDSPYLTPID